MLQFEPVKPMEGDIVVLLREWSEKEPNVCKKTFLSGVFELFVDESSFVNIGREARPDRLYLINLAIEESVRRRGWFIKCNSNAEGWHCVIHSGWSSAQSRPRDPYSVGSGSTRAIALLTTYLKAISAKGGI
jgi:hypothetical protein